MLNKARNLCTIPKNVELLLLKKFLERKVVRLKYVLKTIKNWPQRRLFRERAWEFTWPHKYNKHIEHGSVAGPDPVPFWPLDRGRKNAGTGSGMNIPDHFSESLDTVFWVKIILILWCWSGSGIRNLSDSGSGMEKFGSGINIPDPQHSTLEHGI